MNIINIIADWIFALWFITFPLSIWIVYTVITELLDLILNTRKINRMLKHSDNLRIDFMENEYKHDLARQSTLSPSNLSEMKRQIEYSKMQIKRDKRRYYSNSSDKRRVIVAKNLSDIFRID